MTAQLDDSTHPVVAAVVALRRQLRELAERPVWSLDVTATEAALVEVTHLATQAAQLQLRLLAHADRVEVGAAVGATSPASWLAVETRTTRPTMHRSARLARSLDEAHPAVDQALIAAGVNVEQAHAIVEAVEELSDDVPPETVARAEAFLLAHATDHDARELRRLGRRLLEVIDPETAEAEEARRLEAEEAAARATASFTISDDGHGRCHGRFTIPSVQGAMLRKHLRALASPGRHPGRPTGTPTRRQLGEAFLEYVETRPAESVPHSGGLAATVVVTMTLESLLGGLQAAAVCDGSRISAAEARRLACRAGIVPVVLGGRSEPLDVGRRRRFHTRPQRLALGIRDGGCSARDCDRPPGDCHAHHEVRWADEGHTSVTDGRLLCPRHHTLAHDPRYEMTAHPDRQVSFHRRC